MQRYRAVRAIRCVDGRHIAAGGLVPLDMSPLSITRLRQAGYVVAVPDESGAVSLIDGIGEQRAAQLHVIGITTRAELKAANAAWVAAQLFHVRVETVRAWQNDYREEDYAAVKTPHGCVTCGHKK